MSQSILREEWRDVAGFEGLYQVSNHGRVRSRYKPGARGELSAYWAIRKLTVDSRGYPCVSFRLNDKAIKPPVHRLVLEAFVGPCPEGMECRHLDGNQENNQLDNLAWGTHVENMEDKLRHGTENRGTKHPLARLTDDDVKEIRRRIEAGEKQLEIARDFRMSHAQISRIASRARWRHI